MDNDKQSISVPSEAQAHDKPAFNFPSSKKAVVTQAPIYAALLVAGIIIGVLLATGWAELKSSYPEGVPQPGSAAVSNV